MVNVLYGTGSAPDQQTMALYTLSTSDATPVLHGAGSTIYGPGLAYDTANSTLYELGYNDYDPSQPGPLSSVPLTRTPSLFKVDPSTGNTVAVGALDPTHAGAMSNGGNGLAYDSVHNVLYATGTIDPDGGPFALFSIDAATGAAHQIGLTGHFLGGGLAYDPSHDVLYATGASDAADKSALFTVDRASGAAQLDFTIADDIRFAYNTGATFDVTDGLILASSLGTTPDFATTPGAHSGLYAIDPVNHTTTLIGVPGFGNLGGLAFAPDSVIIPPPTITVQITNNRLVPGSAVPFLSLFALQGGTPAELRITENTSDPGRALLNLGPDSLPPNQSVEVPYAIAARLSLTGGTVASWFTVSAFDGNAWSKPASFVVGTNQLPVVSAGNDVIAAGAVVPVTSLFRVRDADGDPIARYFLSAASSPGAPTGGQLYLNGVAVPHNELSIDSALITYNVTFQASSLPTDLIVQANDGTDWGTLATITVGPQQAGQTPSVNHAPLSTGNSQTTTHSAIIAASSLFSFSDPDGDGIHGFDFMQTSGNGHWLLNGQMVLGQSLTVSTPAQFAAVSYQAGTTGTDIVTLRVNDGQVWGDAANAWISTPLDISIVAPDVHRVTGAFYVLSSFFTVNGGTPTLLRITENTSDPGRAVVNGIPGAEVPNQTVTFLDAWSASASITVGSVASSFTLSAYNGSQWSDPVTFTIDPDQLAVVTGHDDIVTSGSTVAISSLFSVSDPDGDPIARYFFSAASSPGAPTGGQLLLNSVAVPGNELSIDASELGQVTYEGGALPTNLIVQANDGTEWGTLTTIAVQTALPAQTSLANHAPVTTGSNQTGTHGAVIAASSLFSFVDPDGDGFHGFDLLQTAGNGHWLLNGVAVQGPSLTVSTLAQFAAVSFQAGTTGTDLVTLRVNDGQVWGDAANAWVTTPVDHAPVTTGSSQTTSRGILLSASTLFSVVDPDGDAFHGFDLMQTAGNGYWLLNGAAVQGPSLTVSTPAQFANIDFEPGTTGTDIVTLRVNDGQLWGAAANAWIDTPVNHAPVTTGSSQSATHGGIIIAASTLFSIVDPDGDSFHGFDLMQTAGNGHWLLNGAVVQGPSVTVSTPAQFAALSYQAGSTGTDLVTLRVNDGQIWGDAANAWITTPADHAPVTTGNNQNTTQGTAIAASTLFSYSDADGDDFHGFDFMQTAGDGHWLVNGVAVQGPSLTVSTPAQFAAVSYQAGDTGTDLVTLRVNDGRLWGAAANAWITTPPSSFGGDGFGVTFTGAGDTSSVVATMLLNIANSAPVVTADDRTVSVGASLSISGLFTATDPEGDPIQSIQMVDNTTGSGHLTVAGQAQPAGTPVDILAAQLATAAFMAPATPGSDALAVRAFDGTSWSDWKPFQVVTVA